MSSFSGDDMVVVVRGLVLFRRLEVRPYIDGLRGFVNRQHARVAWEVEV
jgi:hypothetical protein